MHSTNFTLGNEGVKQYIEPLLAGLAMHLITGHITAYNAIQSFWIILMTFYNASQTYNLKSATEWITTPRRKW